ncbi:hypothetical protein PFISCL1PPCAC_14469 [Pristionchus fissidentatus]|uniref:N-acetyltransferase domain-containing protein n=1 Tax=Pristionchus fissidentatus TaxID=1538716 RepID=A0AAV5VZ20_9BILA|nr:hypothetical protein PFISCL1PPCAC_14469 [Pristionchus fissidentatus]
MPEIPAYKLIHHGTERLWADFTRMVRDLEWTSTDNTVLWATPRLASTKCIFAQRDDGDYFSTIFENTFKYCINAAFYLTVPSLQGCGLGSKIWKEAMERIKATGKIIGLRAVSNMVAKYTSGETKVEVSRLKKHKLTVDQMKEFCARYDRPSHCIQFYHEMDDDQCKDLLRFDREVTGRNRSAWLELFTASEESEVAVLFNDGKVVTYAGVSTVGHPSANTFKIGPCFASSVAEFAFLAKWLLMFVEKYPSDAKIIVAVLTGSVGERELSPVLGHRISDELVTLFSEIIESKMNLDKCYVPNNSHCHYDG